VNQLLNLFIGFWVWRAFQYNIQNTILNCIKLSQCKKLAKSTMIHRGTHSTQMKLTPPTLIDAWDFPWSFQKTEEITYRVVKEQAEVVHNFYFHHCQYVVSSLSMKCGIFHALEQSTNWSDTSYYWEVR